MEKLDALSEYMYSMERPVENEDVNWVDSAEVCLFLKISDRTLQRLRTNGKITHTRLSGKYYYQIGQVEKLLKQHLIKSTDENLQGLIAHYRRTQR